MVRKADRPKHIIKTALDLAAGGKWASVGLRDIADAADVSLAELHALYPSKTAILRTYFESVDAAVLDTNFDFDEGDTPRDRLFEVLMRRFDVLGEDREAVSAILAALCRDPLAGLCLSRGLPGSMRWMLEAAGLRSSGRVGRLLAKGLGAVWLATLTVWRRDDSPDMARTMAALDRNLRRAERLFALLPTGRRSRKSTETSETSETSEPRPDASPA